MTTAENASWQTALKEPFEAFGILYYPLFRTRADLPTTLDDEDMAWAVTANANLKGTGYTLSQTSILALAAYRHAVAALAHQTAFLPFASAADKGGINPLADLQRLVPDVTASPMYPDFPEQVMQISEAQFRYHQACHYLSTYGVEALAGAMGLDVTVSKGWLPSVKSTPKTKLDDTLVAPKVLHLMVTVEDLQSVVAARLSRATRMHPAEIQTALLVFDGLGDEAESSVFPKIAFHENMMELIRCAAERDSGTLERVAAGLAQHPGDLLKATMYLLKAQPKGHLLTRQKKGLCRAFEHFETLAIAHNIADAGHEPRLAPNYLSVARFGGPRLREAMQMVESGLVRSWLSELERLWQCVEAINDPRRSSRSDIRRYFKNLHWDDASLTKNADALEQAWKALLDHYGQRPGMLFRAMGRLIKGGCPEELLFNEVRRHAESYALPTIVRTLTTMSDRPIDYKVSTARHADFSISAEQIDEDTRRLRRQLGTLLRELLAQRLQALETPLADKRIYFDTSGISLRGSVIVPNEVGGTGTAWPPVGMAWDLPEDKTVRFFTFWDDRRKRVDVDLHFVGKSTKGTSIHIGWNVSFRGNGLATSGDITHSTNAIEFMDADMVAARQAHVYFVVQEQHIYSGARNWGDIDTCYSGAVIVGKKDRNVRLVNPQNLIFRDDLTGTGSRLAYAVINVPNHYVRILRGADLPLGNVDFCLGDYLEALFTAQNVTLTENPDDADLRVCIARSDDPEVISLFDEGFFIG